VLWLKEGIIIRRELGAEEYIASRTFYTPGQNTPCHLIGELTSSSLRPREHNHGLVCSLPLCRQSLCVIPNTHLPQQYLLGNNPPFHRTLTAANFGLVDRVWTFAIVSIFSPQIEPP
jgi:hypothetical protein